MKIHFFHDDIMKIIHVLFNFRKQTMFCSHDKLRYLDILDSFRMKWRRDSSRQTAMKNNIFPENNDGVSFPSFISKTFSKQIRQMRGYSPQ